MLRAERGGNTYQLYSLCFDLTLVRTYDLRTQGEHTNNYTTDAVIYNSFLFNILLQ
jgi:hypothetical protein